MALVTENSMKLMEMVTRSMMDFLFQLGYFALDLRGHMAGGVNPVADKLQSQTIKCEYDKEGDDVALQSLQPNQGVDEKRPGSVVVYAYGLVVSVD